MFRSRALAAGASSLAAFTALPLATAAAAPPAPCNNAPQITDATGDGHHAPTDVLAAWWSEADGRLQAVIQVYAGTPVAEHDEAQTPVAGYALVYTADGLTRYVRASLPLRGTPVILAERSHRHARYRQPSHSRPGRPGREQSLGCRGSCSRSACLPPA